MVRLLGRFLNYKILHYSEVSGPRNKLSRADSHANLAIMAIRPI